MALEANIPELLCRAQSIDIPTVTQAGSQSNGFVYASENACMCMYMHMKMQQIHKDMSTCLHTSCTCANIYVHACYAHARVHTCVRTYVHTHTHLYTHPICTHIHISIHICMRAHTHKYVHTYIHTYMHTYIHSYIHPYWDRSTSRQVGR